MRTEMMFRVSSAVAVALSVMTPVMCAAAQYDIGIGIGIGSTYSYHSLNDLTWNAISPGDEIIIHAGTYGTGSTQFIYLPQGSTTNPVTIHGAWSEAVPTIHDTIFFNGPIGVTLQQVAVAPTISGDAITVTNGSSGVVIVGCEIFGSDGAGITVYNGSGANIAYNNIHDNANDGIGVHDITTHPSQITGNSIHHNKVHAIEVLGNNNSVTQNTIWSNGNATGTYPTDLGTFGTSGIHILGSVSGGGKNNIIAYNVIYDQHSQGIDGNGIEADTDANNNHIYFNVVYLNDGNGILIFDSTGNWAYNNTLYGNGRNSFNGAGASQADLAIVSASDSLMANNLVYSVQPSIANYTVASFGADNYAMTHYNTVETNVFWPLGTAKLYGWTDSGNVLHSGTSLSAWNTLKTAVWTGSAVDLSMDPLLSNPGALVATSSPGTALTLTAGSSGSPLAVRCGGLNSGATTDIAGTSFAASKPPIGAYAPTTACP